MTKTVCDICNKSNAKFHCILPINNTCNITGGYPSKILAKFIQLESVEIDLCDKHAKILANFLELLENEVKENEVD